MTATIPPDIRSSAHYAWFSIGANPGEGIAVAAAKDGGCW
ncbi:hypothetical protein H4W31_005169 [Plantactinospora soyae]|uniref:Uncharacterized protein n=1 Tax=Plantactinospora soyae TaxID=1544732 RepID=A0A927MAF2_9ACTN|nr:hypothetical protein [Plantactinospora soyae]